MKDEFKFFDIMQNYEPEEKLLSDKASKSDKERIKFLVFKKKGDNYMMIKRLPAAVAAMTITVLLGGTMGANAATGGAVKEAVVAKGEAVKEAVVENVSKIFHVKVTEKDGKVREEEINVTENKDGSMTYSLPAIKNGESVTINDDDNQYEVSMEAGEGVADMDLEIESNVKIKEDEDGKSVEVEEKIIDKNN